MIQDSEASTRVFGEEQLSDTTCQSNQEVGLRKELDHYHILRSRCLASRILASRTWEDERTLWQVCELRPTTNPQCHGLLPKLKSIFFLP